MLSIALLSSSSGEEEYTKSEISAMRRQLRTQSNIYSMPDSVFIRYFRLNKQAFKYVLEKISIKLGRQTRSTCISNITKLAVTLRILAEGSYQKGAGNDYHISLGQSAVSNSFKDCINAIYEEICPNCICFPTNEEEKLNIKEYFFNKTGFPGVIGCIDGTHIKIIAPKLEERFKYFNRKGYYSLNATVVCDHKLRIRYISANNPGSVHDSLVWNISDLKQYLSDKYDRGERNSWLLGDSGYPLEKYLITPFRSAGEGSPESRFNCLHAKTRNVVERSIGVLKNRFRCILGARQLHYTPEMAGKITTVCAALHNICINFKIGDDIIETTLPSFESTFSEINDDLNGVSIRSTIMNSLNI